MYNNWSLTFVGTIGLHCLHFIKLMLKCFFEFQVRREQTLGFSVFEALA
jgi:hypothetical protein